VLSVSIPVAEKAKARKITVTRADVPAAVEGRTIEGESQTTPENAAVES
jgi:HSP20 family protein